MDIAIPMYDRFTALDAVGPYEVLSRLPDVQVTWLAHEPGLVRTDNRMLAIEATAAFEDLPEPDIILVPGGTGTRDLLEDERLLAWLRKAHETSTWTTSIVPLTRGPISVDLSLEPAPNRPGSIRHRLPADRMSRTTPRPPRECGSRG